jgi:hypothetical protein
MLDVHPPHERLHSWRDFFIHIATIAVGLLIAIGLEQTVEYFHHRHQLRELHDQLHEVLENNLRLEPAAFSNMADFRAYHVELLAAINARIAGRPLAAEPKSDDPRMKALTSTPSLAPYEVARLNGTVALLPSGENRMYNRMSLQRETYMATSIASWFHAILEMESFEEQFVDSAGALETGDVVTSLDLSQLSREELRDYRLRIAGVIKATDTVRKRILIFDAMCRVVLGGARDENALLTGVGNLMGANQWKDLEIPNQK